MCIKMGSCNITSLNQTLLQGNLTCPNVTSLHSNSTVLAVSSEDSLMIQGAAKYLCYIFYGLVFFFGTVGNIIVFYVIGYRKKKRNGGDFYILSLACADFLSSVFIPMVMLNDLITDFSDWFYGEMMCHALPAITPVTLCASSWSLVLISLDRYRVILKPMSPRLRKSILYGSIAMIWISAVAIGLPYALRLQLVGDVCWDFNNEIISKKAFLAFIAFWLIYIWGIPNIVIIFVYFLTARALKANTLKHENNRAMALRNKQNAKIVKMFIIIIIIFFVLTMPYAVFYFYGNYKIFYDFQNVNFKVQFTLNYTLFIAATANGCINPLIYAKMHREINGYLKGVVSHWIQFFRQRFRRRNQDRNVPSSTWSVSTAKTDDSSL